jgi:hypothetical protein
LVFLYFVFLTGVMTYPLVFQMQNVISGGGGDGTYFVWLVRWYQKALFELKISPFFNPYLNYPQGWNLASTDTTPAMIALAFPGSIFCGPVCGYSFAMFMSFVLSGWGMYLWIRDLTKNNVAGLIAGTIYAYLPFHMSHFIIGHLNLAGIQWFPFYFWGLYDLLRQEKFVWKSVLLASISLFLIGLTSSYYVYMTVLISAVFILGYIIFGGYTRLKDHEFWKSILIFGFLSSVLVGLAIAPFVNLDAQSGLASRSVEYVSEYSASPTDYVIPSINQFLWGGWIDNHFSPEIWQESTLYIGIVTFSLAIIAWVKRRQLIHSKLLYIAIFTAFCAFILSLGIDIHWLGKKVVSLPLILQPIFHRVEMPEIYLPAYYLFRYLPYFSKMRVMMRFGLFTLISFSLMAGLGTQVLLKSYSQNLKRWIAAGLLLMVFIDFYPGPLKGFAHFDARPVDYWLATQPNIGSVAQFPFNQESDQIHVYYTLVNKKTYLGGFYNANQPEQYTRIQPVMDNFPSQDSVALLHQLDVAYVVVDSSQYGHYDEVDHAIQSFGLKLLHVSESEFVYGWP